MGRERKTMVDFVMDFNNDYLDRVNVEERGKRPWREGVLALGAAHKGCKALQEATSSNMDKMLHELEVQKMAYMGIMTNAFIKMAPSIHELTRLVTYAILIF